MFYRIHVILFAVAFAYALPTLPDIRENEIANNEVNFDKELPGESEYYRTSTDRDDFVPPTIPTDNANSEIEDNGKGINVDELSKPQPNQSECMYTINITEHNGQPKDLKIQINATDNLTTSNNVSFAKILQSAQNQILGRIKGEQLTQEAFYGIATEVKKIFTNAIGYEDNCGFSFHVNSEYPIAVEDDVIAVAPDLEDQNKVSAGDESTTETLSEVQDLTTIIVGVLKDTALGTRDDSTTTEEYHSRILKRPKLRENTQAAIDVYKALKNWRYLKQ